MSGMLRVEVKLHSHAAAEQYAVPWAATPVDIVAGTAQFWAVQDDKTRRVIIPLVTIEGITIEDQDRRTTRMVFRDAVEVMESIVQQNRNNEETITALRQLLQAIYNP